jgi:hypothetical protein
MKSQRLAEEAAKMYSDGLAVEAVAQKLGVAYRTARKAIKAGGIEFRDPSQRLVGRTRPDRKIVTNA